MKARALCVAALALALLLAVPAAALAKGASAATIDGPGIGGGGPITLRGQGEPGSGTKLAELSDQAGLFAAMFADEGRGEILMERPSGDLGPRYTITYDIPADQRTMRVVQDLYPYAAGGPVTFARPGQRLWSNQTITGGWFRGPATLLPMLISLGLPSKAPRGASPSAPPPAPAPAAAPAAPAATTSAGTAWWLVATAAGGLAVAFAALALLTRRRRPVVHN